MLTGTSSLQEGARPGSSSPATQNAELLKHFDDHVDCHCRYGLQLNHAKAQVGQATASSQTLQAQAAEAQVSVVRHQAQVKAVQQRKDSLAEQAAALEERLKVLGTVSDCIIIAM
jgi:hypothetical protein